MLSSYLKDKQQIISKSCILISQLMSTTHHVPPALVLISPSHPQL